MARRFRIAEKDSIPTHVESVALRGPWRVGGLVGGLALLVGGLTLVTLADGRSAEQLGPLAAILGLAALTATVRLGRAETVIGTVRVECRIGPFRLIAPSGSIAQITRRPAHAWRRLYSDEELVLRSQLDRAPIVIPAADPDALREAIEAVG